MDDDQQFCLRWNNHQSTLVSVFDTLLEKGNLVDCTLAAEGKYLKAHKVVLSACSPYFETLLSQQYDKHPIFILKDVKFQELQAMMDYMYRGEVNISQDQLGALLKAAESLQIKGLSDSRGGGGGGGNKDNKSSSSSAAAQAAAAPPPPARSPPPQPQPSIPRVQGLTIEQRRAPKIAADGMDDSASMDGSTSPVPRKRKKPRRRTSQEGMDNHDASNSSESHSNSMPATSASSAVPSSSSVNAAAKASAVAPPPASSSSTSDVPEPMLETKPDISAAGTAHVKEQQLSSKVETHTELMLEPKAEYIEEEMNEDSVEDLTLDDDDFNTTDDMMDRAGPSHQQDTSQGFGGWQMSGDRSQDEVFLAAQEAVGAHRDSQGSRGGDWFDGGDLPDVAGGFACDVCGRVYKHRGNLRRHEVYECGKQAQFKCHFCHRPFHQQSNLKRHVETQHLHGGDSGPNSPAPSPTPPPAPLKIASSGRA